MSNDLFRINNSNEIPTIGGLRLGGSIEGVPKEERNAALGQVVHLLCVLANKDDKDKGKFVSVGFKLHPNGANSKISILNQKGKFPLYSSKNENYD